MEGEAARSRVARPAIRPTDLRDTAGLGCSTKWKEYSVKKIVLFGLFAIAPLLGAQSARQVRPALVARPMATQALGHEADLTITHNGAGCNTATPCFGNLYRVQVSGPTASCPLALTSYTEIATSLPAATISATSETSTYADQDPALASGASYCYVATASYQTGLGGEERPWTHGARDLSKSASEPIRYIGSR